MISLLFLFYRIQHNDDNCRESLLKIILGWVEQVLLKVFCQKTFDLNNCIFGSDWIV